VFTGIKSNLEKIFIIFEDMPGDINRGINPRYINKNPLAHKLIKVNNKSSVILYIVRLSYTIFKE